MTDLSQAIAFDTETRGLQWFEDDEQAFLGTWADNTGEWHADLAQPDQRATFLRALSAAKVVIAHNLKFDVHQTRATTGYDLLNHDKEFHDTDLMSRILTPEGQRKDRGGHGLKNLATVYLRADAQAAEDDIVASSKQIGLRTLKAKGAYYDVWRAYPELMERYARDDSRFTYDLAKHFLSKFNADERLWKLYLLEVEAVKVLIRAEQRGIQLDTAAVERLYEHYAAREKELEAALNTELGDVYKGEGSQEALLEQLQMMGVPLHKKTPQGHLSVAEFALEEFTADFPVLADLVEWKRVRKILSTYIAPMRHRNTVHCSFQPCSAWTGRQSCRSPNMQNLPKRTEMAQDENLKARSMFVPREGCAFVVADYVAVEMHVLAYYMGNQEYRDLIASGDDPHAYTAAAVYGGEPADYYKSGNKRNLRDTAKNVTFAITYGAGAPKVSQMTGMDLKEARRVVKVIKDSLPGYKALNARIKAQINAKGHVRTLLGRKQIVPPEKWYVGLNAIGQGTAADIQKTAVVQVAKLCEDYEGAIPLLFVHDEILIECKKQDAVKLSQEVKRVMETCVELDPPLSVEVGITEESYAHVH